MRKYYLFTLRVRGSNGHFYITFCSKVIGSLIKWLDETRKIIDAEFSIVNSIEITKEEWEESHGLEDKNKIV